MIVQTSHALHVGQRSSGCLNVGIWCWFDSEGMVKIWSASMIMEFVHWTRHQFDILLKRWIANLDFLLKIYRNWEKIVDRYLFIVENFGKCLSLKNKKTAWGITPLYIADTPMQNRMIFWNLVQFRAIQTRVSLGSINEWLYACM